MKVDIAQKRGVFIGKMNSILQEFHFATPDVIIKLMNIYATTLYGSNTWNIFSNDCEKLYSSFNVAVRQILRVDRCTHRYLIEALSQCHHLKTVIASRYVTFHKTLLASRKKPVRFLARLNEIDLRTVMGQTLFKLMSLIGIKSGDPSDLTANQVKKNLKYAELPVDEAWRVPLCQELIEFRTGGVSLEGFTSDEVEDILRGACVS